METHQHQQNRERAAENNAEVGKLRKEDKELQATKQQSQTSPVSPPSASSSPSHEFSFTISLHSPSTPTPGKSKVPPSFAIDLSPADDIFFHGHLLPLHLLSHLPVSPRSSTNSSDSYTLPIRESLNDRNANKESSSYSISTCSSITTDNNECNNKQSNQSETKESSKFKSFSLFGFTRWRKGSDVREKEDREKHKRTRKFDISHGLKRYLRMVRTLMFFRGRRENIRFRRQPYSFSGNLTMRNKKDLRGRRGEYSAPASMRTSPTNSGLLLATTTFPSASDSTMEELQAAIQAAIAHCKNSIATEEKLKC